MSVYPTIEDLTIEEEKGKYGLISRVCSDPEPFDPWEDDDAYEGVKVYGPSVVPKGMEWHYPVGNRYDDCDELIRLARLDGWTVIPVYDLPDTSQPDYRERDAESANGFLAVRVETAAEWFGRGSRRTIQRRARQSLRWMIEERARYYRGEAYGFVIEGPGGVVESVWGFQELEEAESEASYALANAEAEAEREQAERQAWAERDVMTV